MQQLQEVLRRGHRGSDQGRAGAELDQSVADCWASRHSIYVYMSITHPFQTVCIPSVRPGHVFAMAVVPPSSTSVRKVGPAGVGLGLPHVRNEIEVMSRSSEGVLGLPTNSSPWARSEQSAILSKRVREGLYKMRAPSSHAEAIEGMVNWRRPDAHGCRCLLTTSESRSWFSESPPPPPSLLAIRHPSAAPTPARASLQTVDGRLGPIRVGRPLQHQRTLRTATGVAVL